MSTSPPFLSTGVVYTVHWRYASRLCEHTDKNHILARLPAREGDRLHRVDGISQLWFDNVETMRVAMESAEQRACIEDIPGVSQRRDNCDSAGGRKAAAR